MKNLFLNPGFLVLMNENENESILMIYEQLAQFNYIALPYRTWCISIIQAWMYPYLNQSFGQSFFNYCIGFADLKLH